MQKFTTILFFLICCLSVLPLNSNAYTPPRTQNVHIELHYQASNTTNIAGNTRKDMILPFSFFMLNDIYTNNERKIGCESFSDGVTAFDFKLNHPLYDYIQHGIDIKIPFYVEPGDSLIINLTKTGKVLSYKQKNGNNAKYTNLLLHDFSNNILYTEQDFNEDKKEARFPTFVQRIMRRMNYAVDSISRNADRYSFSNIERRIAINNAKLQFAVWIFEFASFKAMELNSFSSSHKGGWQSLPNQDITLSDLEKAENYSFLRSLPLNDSTCLASRNFQAFIMSYEHTHILNYDQYLYYGTSLSDQARMDSAYIAKEMKLTGHLRPSLFMDIAMLRKHFDAPVIDDGSIKLDEVQVLGHQATYNKEVTPEEMNSWRINQRPSLQEQLFSPTYWMLYRKQYKNRERAKKVIKQIEIEEAADEADREAIMKAYEEEMERREKE